MTLRTTSLLRQPENPSLGAVCRAQLCCDLARRFEDKGEYEEARNTLAAYWQRVGERPKLTGLEPGSAAELLLRAGVLTGVIGSKNQIPEAQETAKDLISESLNLFQSLADEKKIAEAQTELALCYWRTGEINEARDLLNETLSQLIVEGELRAKALLRLAIVELEASRYGEALSSLTDNAPLFQKISNETIRGSYYVTLGNVLENLWETEKRADYLDRVIIDYAAASYHFELAEHRPYLANVENNLGFLYFKINRCEEAHQHLDHARRVLANLKDATTIAQVDETRACVFLKQGRIAEAEQAARGSVRTLENSGRHALLTEALITHGRALARLGNYSASLSTFRRAIALAQHVGSINRAAEAALLAFDEIGEHLSTFAERKLNSDGTLGEEIQSFEHDLIKRALERAQGSVTHAARSLGTSYQALSYMLETRHKNLLKERTPVRPRSRKMNGGTQPRLMKRRSRGVSDL
jgi:tetratricopeptide (TPR) repeat protein